MQALSEAVVSDAVLVERSWHEPERFAGVFDRYYDPIHRFLARRLGASLADDLASETFLIAFDRRRDYDLRYPSAAPWLYGIAAKLVARHHRAELRRYRALSRLAASDEVEGHAERVSARLRLAPVLASLRKADRDVLLLVAWGGLSCEDAARALGIPAGTARSRLHRARRRTAAALREETP
jgi:RNA polymerase sigma-70 factor (ECF subfamily)